MPTLLKIDVSPRGEYSLSRQLSKQFGTDWQKAHAGGTVDTLDLATMTIPFVDLPWIAGAYSAPEQHTPEQKAALKVSDDFIAQLMAADELVISTPMYNFNIPAVLKAWIDHVVRKDKTFSVGAEGYKGLITDKKATVIITSGGAYPAGTPWAAYNAETPYLKLVLGFLGITDVTFVEAGGTNDVSQGKTTKEAFLEKFAPEVMAAAGK